MSFLERIFMKSAYSYKAAHYKDTSLAGGFWAGRCVDKQINDAKRQVSNYWIIDFLASSLRLTSAAGTHRLAVALRGAVKAAPDLAVRQEITAAVTLAQGLKGQQFAGEGPEILQLGGVLGRDDEPEMMPVILAPLGEGALVRSVGLSVEQAGVGTVSSDALALQVGDMLGQRR